MGSFVTQEMPARFASVFSLSVSGDNRSLLPVTAEEGSDKRLASWVENFLHAHCALQQISASLNKTIN